VTLSECGDSIVGGFNSLPIRLSFMSHIIMCILCIPKHEFNK
jgi:hypothetical protein